MKVHGVRNYVKFDPIQAPEEPLDRGVGTFFLYPADQYIPDGATDDDVRPRYMGWTQVHEGKTINRDGGQVLTMTYFNAEDNKSAPVRAGTWLRKLSNDLKTWIKYGVEAYSIRHDDEGNVIYDGGENYSDCGYSDGGVQLLERGYLWKYDLFGYVAYSPPGRSDLVERITNPLAPPRKLSFEREK